VIARYRTSLGFLGLLLAVTACGASTQNSGAPSTSTTISTTTTSLGTVLTGPSGNTVYVLLSASGSSVPCTGACAAAWPPVTISQGSSPQAGAGVTATLATVTRSDGTVQVTANGSPIYYFASDSGPGQASGQGIKSFGGTWSVVETSGKPMTSGTAGSGSTPAPTSMSAPAPTSMSSGGGYGY
jgi:predicted lipoprotein with Yx(FWY)xxD motif